MKQSNKPARIGIYLPAALKARMDHRGKTLNWSRIAQKAFERALDDLERHKWLLESSIEDERLP